MTPATYPELIYLHTQSYGRAVRFKKRWMQIAVTALCLATPCTNWMIPFILPRMRDCVVRWGV